MKLLVDPLYDPMVETVIDSSTKLGPGVSISTFLGSQGNRSNFNYILSLETKQYIARQLYGHAEVIRSFRNNPEFKEFRLVPVESIFEPIPGNEFTTGSINHLKYSGRLVVYEVRNNRGEIDFGKTYDIAVFWKDHIKFDNVALSYDVFNPDKSLTGQIMLTLPVVAEDYEISVSLNRLETWYNGRINLFNELAEIITE